MGESHIDFHMQYAIMTLAGGGRVIDNDTLKVRKVIEFQNLCHAATHLCR